MTTIHFHPQIALFFIRSTKTAHATLRPIRSPGTPPHHSVAAQGLPCPMLDLSHLAPLPIEDDDEILPYSCDPANRLLDLNAPNSAESESSAHRSCRPTNLLARTGPKPNASIPPVPRPRDGADLGGRPSQAVSRPGGRGMAVHAGSSYLDRLILQMAANAPRKR